MTPSLPAPARPVEMTVQYGTLLALRSKALSRRERLKDCKGVDSADQTWLDLTRKDTEEELRILERLLG